MAFSWWQHFKTIIWKSSLHEATINLTGHKCVVDRNFHSFYFRRCLNKCSKTLVNGCVSQNLNYPPNGVFNPGLFCNQRITITGVSMCNQCIIVCDYLSWLFNMHFVILGKLFCLNCVDLFQVPLGCLEIAPVVNLEIKFIQHYLYWFSSMHKSIFVQEFCIALSIYYMYLDWRN